MNPAGDNSHSRATRFLRDFGLYAIGVLGPRLVSFLLLPLYTYFIDRPEEYGYFDLCLTVVMMLIPVVTLQLREGAFRFLATARSDNQRAVVVRHIYRTLMSSLMITATLVLVLAMLGNVAYLWPTVAMLVAMSVHDVSSQVCRGLGHTAVYVRGNLLTTTLVGLLSIVFVGMWHWGIAGIFATQITAHFAGTAYNEWHTHSLRLLRLPKQGRGRVAASLMQYCLPLIPIALCLWVTNNAGRLFVSHYLGFEANGIYAVAVRFAAIVQTIALVFYQSWQETSLRQFHAADRDTFFSQMFAHFVYVLSAVTIVCCFALKFAYPFLVGAHYQRSLRYIYPLMLSAALSALATAFFDPAYQSARKTGRAMPGIMLSAVVNVGLNIWLVPRCGIGGAAIASVAAFAMLLIWRVVDTRKMFRLRPGRRVVVAPALAVASALPFYFNPGPWADIAWCIVCAVVLLMMLPGELRALMHTLTARLFTTRTEKPTERHTTTQ